MKRLSILALFPVYFLSGVAFCQSTNIYTFCPDVKVTDAPPQNATSILFQSSGQHFTAFRGDTVYVVWWEGRFSYPPAGSHVFFGKSTDTGKSFAPAVRVNDLSAGGNPSMRVDSCGVIYVAYQVFGNIYFTKSTDGGSSFTPSLLVVDGAGLDSLQERPSIAVNDRGHVHIAWMDERTDPGAIFTAASYDGGQTFGPNIQAGRTYAGGAGFDIAADNSGRVYVVLTFPSEPSTPNKFPIYLSRSDDSGQTFQLRGMVTDLPTDTALAWGINPSMAVGDGLVGIAWEDARSNQPGSIRFSISSDYGEFFSTSSKITDSASGFASNRFPSVSASKGVFYTAWDDIRFRQSDSAYIWNIFMSYTVDRGQTFVANRGTDTSGRSFVTTRYPSLAVSKEGKAFVAWIDDRYDPIFQERWLLFGATAEPNFIKGDLNLDGRLTLADIVLELNAVFLSQPFPAPFASADGNCDGQLSSSDISLLLLAAFLRSGFPC